MSFRTKHVFLIAVVGGIIVASIITHIYLNDSAADAKGLLAVLDHVFDLTLALGLYTIVAGVGNELAGKLRLVFANTAEEIVVSVFLGTGTLGLSVLIIGLLGLLRPLPVALLLALLSVVARQGFVRLFRSINESIRNTSFTRETIIVVLFLVALVLLLVLRAANPPNAADELIYHLPVPKAFVEHGRIYPMLDNSLGNLPFLIHSIYAVCILAGSDIAARLFSLFLALAIALALYGFCSRYLTTRTGVVAMFAFFAPGMVVEVAITTRIDVSLAGMLFLTTYALINYLDSEKPAWLWASGLLAGFSLGIKHSAGIWLLLIGLMYLVETLIRKRQRVATSLARGITYALIAAAVASPWYIKNLAWFQNPLYPLVTGEVVEYSDDKLRYFDANDERKLNSYFDQALKEIPEEVNAQDKEITDEINKRVERQPLLLWNLFLKPNTYLMSEPNQYPNYLFLIIPLLFFFTKPRWIVWLLVLATGFVFAVTATSWIARYLLPAYPALTIVAAYTLTAVSQRIAVLRSLPTFLLAALLGVVVSASILSMRKFNSLRFVTGMVSRQELLARFTYYKPIDFINRSLPENARVMLIGAQLNYGIERPYVGDETWFVTKWRRLLVQNNSLEEVNEDLKRQGFTHILYSPAVFPFAAQMGTKGTGGMELIAQNQEDASPQARRLGPDYQFLRNWSTFTLYQQKYLEIVYSDHNGYFVLKIK